MRDYFIEKCFYAKYLYPHLVVIMIKGEHAVLLYASFFTRLNQVFHRTLVDSSLFSVSHETLRTKPRLTASEACHRLALIEGQKENRTLEKTRG